MVSADPRETLAASLQGLGFSPYEARCYAGLLGSGPQTGYGVAKITGVPQPKVYETLRRLEGRGAARQVADEPALFVATPPETFFSSLASDFTTTNDTARRAALAVQPVAAGSQIEPLTAFTDSEAIFEAARAAIGRATRRIYISASSQEFSALEPALKRQAEAGVHVIVLAFGGQASADDRGFTVFLHASTEDALYRHHQARHLAVVVDSRETVNALARDGSTWSAISTENDVVVAAVKGMIKHDIDVQQIYRDFGADLLGAYGPGLQQLEAYRRDPDPRGVSVDERSDGASRDDEWSARRRRVIGD